MTARPTEIAYGRVRRLTYLEDFGRFEALVTLHMEGEACESTTSYLTNVDGHAHDRLEDVKLRLVLKAARLHRLAESGLVPMEPAHPLAA